MDMAGKKALAMQEYWPPLDVYNGLNWRLRVVVLAESIPGVNEIPLPPVTLVPFLNHIT